MTDLSALSTDELEATLAARKTAAAATVAAPTAAVESTLVVGQLVKKDAGTEHESAGIVLALHPSVEQPGQPGVAPVFSAPGADVGWFASTSELPESALEVL